MCLCVRATRMIFALLFWRRREVKYMYKYIQDLHSILWRFFFSSSSSYCLICKQNEKICVHCQIKKKRKGNALSLHMRALISRLLFFIHFIGSLALLSSYLDYEKIEMLKSKKERKFDRVKIGHNTTHKIMKMKKKRRIYRGRCRKLSNLILFSNFPTKNS